MSGGWRQGRTDIPSDLHHRPVYFVQHMREAEQKAAEITPEMVHDNCDGTYRVLSSSGGKSYTVDTGDDMRMPSCECLAFQKLHMPCKHFSAVFTHCNVTWSSLPQFYCNHPLFTCDLDSLNLLNLRQDCFVQNGGSDQENSGNDAHESMPHDDDVPFDIALQVSEIDHAARRCRDVLSNINNLTYLSKSSVVLNEATQILAGVHDIILRTCLSDDGLLLLDVDSPTAQCQQAARKRSVPRNSKDAGESDRQQQQQPATGVAGRRTVSKTLNKSTDISVGYSDQQQQPQQQKAQQSAAGVARHRTISKTLNKSADSVGDSDQQQQRSSSTTAAVCHWSRST